MNVETRLLDLSCQGRRKILILEGGGGGMMIFSQKFLRTLKIFTKHCKKKYDSKKICFVLKLTIYNKQEFLATRSIPFEFFKKNFTFKILRPGYLGSNNYY